MGHFKYISNALCVAFSVICPHGFSISVLQSKLIICKLQKEFSCNFAAQDGILVSCFEGMTCCLDFCINLDELFVTLLEFYLDHIDIGIFGSSDFSFDRLSQRSPLHTNSEDSIHLLEVQVPYCEGEVVLSCSIADLNLDTLARNSVNMNMYVPVLGRVDIFNIQLGFSVRLNLYFHVGDCSRDDGLATEGACGSFDGSSPHITCMGTLNHQVTLFFTITVTVYHDVVNSHLEQTITNSCTSIKIKVQIHLIAVCLLENLLQIINFEVNFSSLQWVSSILVLEPHVDSQKVK